MKKMTIKKIYRFQYILFGILIATVLYLIFNPEYLYEKEEYFKTEYNRYQTSKYLMHFSFLPDNPDFDVVKVLIEKRLILIYRNLETNNVGQIELPGYSVNHIIGGTSIFYDEQDNTVEIILSQNGADYFLYELYSSEYRDESKIHKIFYYDLYEELQDSTIVLHNIKFYEYICDEGVEKDFFIESYKDGYRFIIYPDLWYSLRKVSITEIEENELYYSICEGLNKITNMDFQPADIYQIMQFFVRNSYYEKVLFSLDNRDINGFVGARIAGKIDSNKDGIKDYLILVSGKRWICDKLICYDKIKQEILWEREFAYGTTDEFKIFDIDNDGLEEIIFSTNAYCNEFPIDWLRKKEVGKTYLSYLYILDNQGNTKIINGKPAIVESEIGLNKFHYLPIFEKSKILIGLESHNEIVERRLILYDLIDNSIDTLDIYYKSLIGFYEEDDNIITLNYNKNVLEKIIISKEFKMIKAVKNKIYEGLGIIPPPKCEIEGVDYLVLTPFTILNKKNEILYTCPLLVNMSSAVWKDNKIYFIEKQNELTHFSSLEFTRNREVNPYVIIVLLVEILLLSLYFLIRQYITIPIISATNSYFILYKILGKLFYWRLYGKLKQIYVLPKKMSLLNEIPQKILYNISEEPELIYERNFFFLKFKVYEISSTDEFLIIQRISHELKNQVLMLKLMTEEFAVNLSSKSQKYISNMSSSLKDISNAAITLSNFSHINKLYPEKVEINNFIESSISQYINHKYFEKIQTEYKNKDIEYKLDKSLFRIAFKNLLDNSLDAIDENGYIKIEVFSSKENLYIIIKNSCIECPENIQNFHEVGYSTKEQGSGIGIPIAKTIIEKHGGSLEINYEKKEVVITIALPI